jgi:hypothetical protein
MQLDKTTRILIPALIVLAILVSLLMPWQCAKAQTVQYKGWQYDAPSETLTLTFVFPAKAVKTLQLAGGLSDAKAIADKMGKQAAEGFRNVVSNADESEKGKLSQWFKAKATAAQKQAFETWVDTVGTYERNNPIITPETP